MGDWRYAAARAVGTSHVRSGLPCQDRIACAVLPDGTLVATLADGAGSAAMGDVGAQIAVETVLSCLGQRQLNDLDDPEAVLLEAAMQARNAVLSEALTQGLPPRAFASTLLALILGPQRGAALQIGDGVIVLSDGADEWNWMFWPQRGEYANTTFFLTDDDAAERLQVESFSAAISDAALLSDGLEPLALHYASMTVHDPFFAGMFRALIRAEGSEELPELSAALETFLTSERVGARTDDDVSLVLATRRCPADRE